MAGLAKRGGRGAMRAKISVPETRSRARSTAGGSDVNEAAVRMTVTPMPISASPKRLRLARMALAGPRRTS